MHCQTKPGSHAVSKRTIRILAVKCPAIRPAVYFLSAFLIALFALFALFACCVEPVAAQDAPANAPIDVPIDTPIDTPMSGVAQQVLADVNQARIDNGLPALTLSPLLTLAAQRHVDDVIANGNWGHYGSDGSNIQMRVARVGYSTSSVSENWVAVSEPGQAIGWWMNDWIHRVNILEPHWDEVGVGAAQAGNGFWILVTDFGNIDGGALPPVSLVATAGDFGAGGDAGGETEAVPDDGNYTIRGGDTLLGIAIRFGLDWQDIALSNNMQEDDLLQIGDVIRLPLRGGIGGAVEAPTGAVAGKQTHMVRAGETLWTIAARYKISWQDVAAVNDLRENDLLQIGQQLKLPASLDEPEEAPADAAPADAAAAESDAAEASSAGDAESTAAAGEAGEPVLSEEAARFAQKAKTAPAPETEAQATTYTVKSGDTLLGIALQYELEWQTLADANGLTEDSFLQIGDTLTVPTAPSPENEGGPGAPTSTFTGDKQAPATAPRIHRVERGDTLFGIALEYGVDLQDLLTANDLDEDTLLQLDQELTLP